MKSLFTFILIILFHLHVKAQGNKDNSSFIETKTGGILIFNNLNKFDLYFYVDLKNTSVRAAERKNLYTIGDKSPLQVLAIDKSKFAGNTEAEIFEVYTTGEIAYFNDQFKAKLDKKSEMVKLNRGTGYFWHYKLPESVAKDVGQIYLTFIHEGFLISLYSAQFPDQKFDDVKALLVNAANSIVFSEERITLEYLCRERK